MRKRERITFPRNVGVLLFDLEQRPTPPPPPPTAADRIPHPAYRYI